MRAYLPNRPTLSIAVVVLGLVTTVLQQKQAVAADQAAIKQSIAKGLAYLRANHAKVHGGRRVLATYAMLKAGVPESSPEVSEILNTILSRFNEEDGTYRPGVPAEAPYQAGVEAMMLADIDPEKYKPQLEAIATYLIESRLESNVWDYKGPTSPGDTSATQYGCLGLWAASRAGVEIPIEIWDQIILWHFRTQRGDGGFAYMPGVMHGPGNGDSTLNMTAGAIGSMTIAAMHLFPHMSDQGIQPDETDDKGPGMKFGILEKDDAAGSAPGSADAPYRIKSTYTEYKRRTQGAVTWLATHFDVQNRVGPAMYYYYSLERMGALAQVDKLGPHDWFNLCADFLISQQKPDGSWTLSIYDPVAPYTVGTSFGVLFMTRSTAKLLNRLPRGDLIGGGLQIGGRGLPENLSEVEMANGRVGSRKPSGPLDELLAELAKSGGDGLFTLQEEIVEKIQLGDRSELVGQTDQLVKLLDYPDPQVRRTAMWALGRSDDLKLVRHAIRALLEDPDRDVLVEAHNALCWFARRPDGLGVPDDPLAAVAPDATDEVRAAAVEKWRAQAIQAWGSWYLRVCPYEERDDPFVIQLGRRIKKRP